ncbi:MAG: GNAT family N-acetyltransferase [Actinobacteria bacterium]|nr:GNAT family N-acetyltransferase [Actinomycetota bacterium]
MSGLGPPDPPLVDAAAGIVLRPWRPADTAALAAAWAEPEIAAGVSVPADRSDAAAARWIGGWSARVESGAALDLVIAPAFEADDVWGEVGLRPLRPLRPRTAAAGSPALTQPVLEAGWWVRVEHRGRGVASAAVCLMVGWALGSAGRGAGAAQVVARIQPGNVASAAVATRVGLSKVGRLPDGRNLWVRSVAASTVFGSLAPPCAAKEPKTPGGGARPAPSGPGPRGGTVPS